MFDICYAVSFISQSTHDPANEHLKVALRILRYLKAAPRQGLYFKKNDGDIQVFDDIGWVVSKTNMRSTAGHGSYLWENLITWRSKKQPVV